MSSPASGDEGLVELPFARHDAVRCVAVLDGSPLTLRERADRSDASAAESRSGHVSVAVEHGADPLAVPGDVRASPART